MNILFEFTPISDFAKHTIIGCQYRKFNNWLELWMLIWEGKRHQTQKYETNLHAGVKKMKVREVKSKKGSTVPNACTVTGSLTCLWQVQVFTTAEPLLSGVQTAKCVNGLPPVLPTEHAQKIRRFPVHLFMIGFKLECPTLAALHRISNEQQGVLSSSLEDSLNPPPPPLL